MAFKEWTRFVHQSLSRRIHGSKFQSLAALLQQESPVSGSQMAKIILASRRASHIPNDPLIARYIDALFSLGFVSVPDLLSNLLHTWKTYDADEYVRSDVLDDPEFIDTLESDTRLIQGLVMAITAGKAPLTAADSAQSLFILSEWLLAIAQWAARALETKSPSKSWPPTSVTFFEAAGFLLATLVQHEQGAKAITESSSKALKGKLSEALAAFVGLVSPVAPHLHDRLEAIRKQYDLYEQTSSNTLEDSIMKGVNLASLNFESNVIDGPLIHARAGLYVYLNACLVGRPLIDDSALINFLNARYGGDHVPMSVDLILALFDILANGMYQKETKQTMTVFRSFLVNKVPAILSYISAASLDPIPMEICITQALSRVDPNAFPSFSATFDLLQGNASLADVRQDFLFACALHKLIPESRIEAILGENPMQTLTPESRYIKEDLVGQITANAERAEQLIGEIEQMEGNVGAIVHAIAEVMNGLCSRRETMTLKLMCNSIVRKPGTMDIILLFQTPASILQPLCALLDGWKWDDDHGESQPVYDEFGIILLLVLAFKYRYDLLPVDLGITDPDSFVLRLMERGSISQTLGELGEAQSRHLGSWISALFNAEGLSDELFSSCSPQEFYLLVATLFSQSVAACEAGKLDVDAMKAGFDYLLESFLLPSLVFALEWLSNHIRESDSDLMTSLQVLQSLVKPSSINTEARDLHGTIISISTNSLERELKVARKKDPSRMELKTILEALEPHRSFRRTSAASIKELESWTTGSRGGLLASIRQSFSSLALWSSTDMPSTPAAYTHKQIIAGLDLFGAVRVLRTIVDELKVQAEAGSSDLATDIAAALICAPTAGSFAASLSEQQLPDPSKPETTPQRHSPQSVTLRGALHLEHQDVAKISETDSVRAELLVRLYRRVETLSVMPPPLPQDMGGLDLQNLNMQATATNANLDVSAMSATGAGAPPAENIDQMLENAEVAAGQMDTGDLGSLDMTGGETLDDMLGLDMSGMGNDFADMDMDMEGVF